MRCNKRGFGRVEAGTAGFFHSGEYRATCFDTHQSRPHSSRGNSCPWSYHKVFAWFNWEDAERKNAMSEFFRMHKEALDRFELPVACFDVLGIITFANDAAEALLQRKPATGIGLDELFQDEQE